MLPSANLDNAAEHIVRINARGGWLVLVYIDPGGRVLAGSRAA